MKCSMTRDEGMSFLPLRLNLQHNCQCIAQVQVSFIHNCTVCILLCGAKPLCATQGLSAPTEHTCCDMVHFKAGGNHDMHAAPSCTNLGSSHPKRCFMTFFLKPAKPVGALEFFLVARAATLSLNFALLCFSLVDPFPSSSASLSAGSMACRRSAPCRAAERHQRPCRVTFCTLAQQQVQDKAEKLQEVVVSHHLLPSAQTSSFPFLCPFPYHPHSLL